MGLALTSPRTRPGPGQQHLDNDDAEWIAKQNNQPTIVQIQEVWVDVLVHGGGAARVPVNTCELIDPIVPFDNYHYNEHFAERDAIEA